MVADDLRAYRRRGGSAGSSLTTGVPSNSAESVEPEVEESVTAEVGLLGVSAALTFPAVSKFFSVSRSTLASESETSPISYRVNEARGPQRSRAGEMEIGERFVAMVDILKLSATGITRGDNVLLADQGMMTFSNVGTSVVVIFPFCEPICFPEVADSSLVFSRIEEDILPC